MYLVVLLLALVLPLGSMAIAHGLDPNRSLIELMGRWFVFWGVGAWRLLAGLRQFFRPKSAQQAYQIETAAVVPIIKELGLANTAMGLVAALSLAFPSFVLPVAIAASVFYGVSGLRHMGAKKPGLGELVITASDLLLTMVLLAYVAMALLDLGFVR